MWPFEFFFFFLLKNFRTSTMMIRTACSFAIPYPPRRSHDALRSFPNLDPQNPQHVPSDELLFRHFPIFSRRLPSAQTDMSATNGSTDVARTRLRVFKHITHPYPQRYSLADPPRCCISRTLDCCADCDDARSNPIKANKLRHGLVSYGKYYN